MTLARKSPRSLANAPFPAVPVACLLMTYKTNGTSRQTINDDDEKKSDLVMVHCRAGVDQMTLQNGKCGEDDEGPLVAGRRAAGHVRSVMVEMELSQPSVSPSWYIKSPPGEENVAQPCRSSFLHSSMSLRTTSGWKEWHKRKFVNVFNSFFIYLLLSPRSTLPIFS